MNRPVTLARLAAASLCTLSFVVFAQQDAHQQDDHRHHHAPAAAAHAAHGHAGYAGLQHRAIKALTAQQIEGYRAGRGMGLAMAAELNGYPGPMHVLELAPQLGLSGDQQASTQAIFQAMQTQAKPLGAAIIDAERELDAMFATGSATPASIETQTQKIARLQGQLRAVHLASHLDMMKVLSAEQVQAYKRLRGY